MQEENNDLITPEGYKLRFKKQEMVELNLEIPKSVLISLEKIAAKRDIPLEAVVKFYIGQNLRQDLTNLFAGNILERTEEVLSKHFKSKEEISEILNEIKSDLAA